MKSIILLGVPIILGLLGIVGGLGLLFNPENRVSEVMWYTEWAGRYLNNKTA